MSFKIMKSVVEECERLLETRIGGLCYPNQQLTNLTDLSKNVTKKLLNRHCKDKSALVAAALGDLPFTKSNLTRLVQPVFGKQVASAWKEMNEAKVYKKSDDCVDNCIGLNLCYDKDCVQKRLAAKGPAMSGSARAALVAWFSVLSHMIAGEEYPRNWSIEDRYDYLRRLKETSVNIMTHGKKCSLTPTINSLAKEVVKNVNRFNRQPEVKRIIKK